jgi:hypothetical protein
MQRPEGPVEGGDRSRGKEVGISRDSYQSARNARLRDQLSSCPPRVCIEALQNLHIGLDSVVYLYRTSPKIENFEGSPCLVNDIHLALNHGLLLLRILLRYHQEAQAWYVPLLSPPPLKTVPLSRCPSSAPRRPALLSMSRSLYLSRLLEDLQTWWGMEVSHQLYLRGGKVREDAVQGRQEEGPSRAYLFPSIAMS